MSDADYEYFLSHPVVLDTGGPIVYLGMLHTVSPAGFTLENADLHDTRSGHATTEEYVNAVRHSGISTNRRRVLVMRSAVMSISRLADIVDE